MITSGLVTNPSFQYVSTPILIILEYCILSTYLFVFEGLNCRKHTKKWSMTNDENTGTNIYTPEQ